MNPLIRFLKLNWLNKLFSYLRLIRINSSLSASLAVIISFFLAGKGQIIVPLPIVLYASLVSFSIASFSVILHDIVDYKKDLRVKPFRPLPSGQVSIREAQMLASVFFVIGFIFAVAADLSPANHLKITLVYYLINSFVIAYFQFNKTRPLIFNNLIIPFSAFSIFIYGDLISNGRLTLLTFLFGFFVFLMVATREIVRGISESEDDEISGAITVALKYGEKFASNFAAFLIFLAILISSQFYFIPQFGRFSKFAIVLLQTVFAYTGIVLILNPTNNKIRHIKDGVIIIGNLLFLIFLLDFYF